MGKCANSDSGKVLLADSPSDKATYFMTYDPAKFEARAEEIPIQDNRLKGAWGERAARIILRSKGQAPAGSHQVRSHQVTIDYHRED